MEYEGFSNQTKSTRKMKVSKSRVLVKWKYQSLMEYEGSSYQNKEYS